MFNWHYLRKCLRKSIMVALTLKSALRKKCPYSELFWSAFFPHFPAFGLNTKRRDTEYLSVFSPNVGKCGKNADQNNSEYGHFLRSASDRETGLLESNRDVLEADNKTSFLIGRSSRRRNNAQQKIYNLVRIIVDILFYKGFGFRLMRRNCNMI